jgi:hypothetical protein
MASHVINCEDAGELKAGIRQFRRLENGWRNDTRARGWCLCCLFISLGGKPTSGDHHSMQGNRDICELQEAQDKMGWDVMMVQKKLSYGVTSNNNTTVVLDRGMQAYIGQSR